MGRIRYCEHCEKKTMQDWVAKDFICRVCHRIVEYRAGKKNRKELLEARFHDECFRTIILLKGNQMQIKHAYVDKIKWFGDSLDHCICSLCGKVIKEEDCPIRFWKEVKA